MDALIKNEGKFVYKRKGLFAGLVGRLVKNPTGLTSHAIEYENWGSGAVGSIHEIVVIGEEIENTKL